MSDKLTPPAPVACGPLRDVLPYRTPWTGCCDYLLCFTSMLLRIEQEAYQDRPFLCWDSDPTVRKGCTGCGKCHAHENPLLAHRERVYKSYLPIAGNGLTNAFDPCRDINQSYYMLDGFIERSFAYAGYAYETVAWSGGNEGEFLGALAASVAEGRPVLCRLRDTWGLALGYDAAQDAVLLCNADTVGEHPRTDWRAECQYLLPVTGAGHPTTDTAAILRNILDVMERTEFDGVAAGFAAYQGVVSFLSDDGHFRTADDDTLAVNYRKVHDYIGYHAEARGFCGEGYKMLVWNEQPGRDLAALLLALSYLGWRHHDIAWDGWNAMNPWPLNPPEHAHLLRDRAVRDRIIDSVERMEQNDRELVSAIETYLRQAR